MLALGLASSKADATTFQDLCTVVPSECEYTGPNAPVLVSSVCWNRTTKVTRLMTGATCPTGSFPFSVKYGIVDPLTGEVFGLVPLPDACTRPGLCSPGYLAPDNTWSAAAMCCIDGVCWPQIGPGGCEGGEILICFEGVSNEDGTVECFDNSEV
jgi:hypothetical protein